MECNNKLLEKNPNDYHIISNNCIIYLTLKDYNKSLECYDKVIGLAPANEKNNYYDLKATNLLALGREEESLEYFDKSVELSEHNLKHSKSLAFYALGNKQMANGNFTKALDYYDKGINMSPGNTDVYYSLIKAKGDVIVLLENKDKGDSNDKINYLSKMRK